MTNIFVMNRMALLNTVLQIGFAALRYGMIGWCYARIDLEEVGLINSLMTYVTAVTFVAGFELHYLLNRPLLLGYSTALRYGLDRIALAGFFILLAAWLADLMPFRVNQDWFFFLLIFMVSTTEYVALEMGRLLIVKGRFLVVTICGFIRSIAPFLAVMVTTPTLKSMLTSWLAGSALVMTVQAVLLWRSGGIQVNFRNLDRADYRLATTFFVMGVTMALMPTLERWLTGTFYSGTVLGQFAIAMTLVSACELVMQGGIWQPFIATILQRLAKPATQRAIMVKLLGIIAALYLTAGVLAVQLSGYLLAWINKDPITCMLLVGVFTLGLGKAIYTLLFYTLYATGQVRVLPIVQVAMVAVLVLSVMLGSRIGFSPGLVFAITGSAWIVFLLSLLIYYDGKNHGSARETVEV